MLDLDEEVSLAVRDCRNGPQALLLDWGPAVSAHDLDIARACRESAAAAADRKVGGPAALVGYCLGGTMAIAAANLGSVERVATIAAPWRFRRLSGRIARLAHGLVGGTRSKRPRQLSALPMEVLQAAFWSLDPAAHGITSSPISARSMPDSAEARRFVELEDWANEGEPLPYPGRSGADRRFLWRGPARQRRMEIGGRAITDALDVPLAQFHRRARRITPAEPRQTAKNGDRGRTCRDGRRLGAS